jgi:high affinity Mn2+ porin
VRAGLSSTAACLLCVRGAYADGGAALPQPTARFALHWQATYIEQETSDFTAPYSGRNSLSPASGRESVDATLYAGARLWPGAQAWINPEIDQGFGLDDTVGLAGFPSGAAYKIGRNQPYLRLQRLFLRQTLNLGAPDETIQAGANEVGQAISADRLVFSLGKLSVTDLFDTNQYAHDPRSDFLNWTALDAGAFDYAADSWGYTVGAAAEWYVGDWTVREGVFDLSDVPNSPRLEPGFDEFQLLFELEHRHEIADRPGRLLFTVYDSRGRMGLLDAAVALAQQTGTAVNIAAVRSYRSRIGASVDLEQQLAPDLGLFARLGKSGGNVETYEFTDVDRAVAGGLSVRGGRWGRADDTIGLAGMINGISAAREQYLNAGGLGILVGDGKLPHPGPEQILETYYNLSVFSLAHVTFDYQWVNHPAYNRDRGPVQILAVRVHLQL